MPYDSEIISFLRRIDRDDDGVITGQELQKFIERFMNSDDVLNTKRDRNVVSRARLECLSPGRKIVQSKFKMIPVTETMTTTITSGHRFIPATDTVIEKTIVQGRRTAEQHVVENVNPNVKVETYNHSRKHSHGPVESLRQTLVSQPEMIPHQKIAELTTSHEVEKNK